MAEQEKVEVITLRPHVERQRRERKDRYFVKPERLAYLVDKGWVKPVAAVVAEAEAEAYAEVEAKEAEVTAETERVDGGSVDELMKEWTLSTSPQDYLKRYPEGKHAPLAQAIVDKIAEE